MTDRIGFVGLGNMGRPMAANLLRHRGDLIVHDLRPAAADDLREEGAVWAGDLQTLAGQVEVVVTSLPGPQQIQQAAFGEMGLFSTLPSGSLWIDTSTNDPALARRLASETAKRGIAFVDAPVTGGVIGARNATLKIMAGGTEKDVERAPGAVGRRRQRGSHRPGRHRRGHEADRQLPRNHAHGLGGRSALPGTGRRSSVRRHAVGPRRLLGP